jgi:benzaldehyde dehydrogenase (NAD)
MHNDRDADRRPAGRGRHGGEAGLPAVTELRWITLQTTPRHDPF